MRRSNLLWFAMGAGTASSVVLASHFLIKGEPLEAQQAYLAVYDKGFATNELDQTAEIASTSARMLHNCKVKQFEIELPSPTDSVPRSLVPLTQANETSFACVLDAARIEKFDHRIIMKANNAQTH